MATFVWSRNSVGVSLLLSFFCGRDPLCEVVQWLENTPGGADSFAGVTSRSLPHLSDQQISAFSSKLQTLYCLFKSHAEIWKSSLLHVFSVYGWLSELTYLRFFFFQVICWSYLWMEISVILSTGNKLHFCLCWCYLFSSSTALCRQLS